MTSAETIRVDSELKAEFEELFDDIGLNMTTAITCLDTGADSNIYAFPMGDIIGL